MDMYIGRPFFLVLFVSIYFPAEIPCIYIGSPEL